MAQEAKEQAMAREVRKVYKYITLKPCEHPQGVINGEGVIITSSDGDLPDHIFQKVE